MNYDKMAKQNKPCLFSSRRRNTRWTGDWSSDVCSSDLTAVLELDFMLDVAATIAHSALGRRESRGAHSRSDHPNRDDANYLKHTLAFRTDGAPRIDYAPVTITKWQPVERKY